MVQSSAQLSGDSMTARFSKKLQALRERLDTRDAPQDVVQTYLAAVREPILAARDALWGRTFTRRELDEAFTAAIRAQDAARAFNIAVSISNTSTARERIDAAVAEEKAESDCEVLAHKYTARKDKDTRIRKAEQAGRVRYRAIAFTDADGNDWIRTGRYRRIGGERIPVYQKVEYNE